MTDAAVDASRPVVGSSRNKTDGDIINSIPILVRFRSPPEIPRMNSFPTCHSKSEISKGQGCVFTCFFCKRMWLHFASLSHYFTKIEGIIVHTNWSIFQRFPRYFEEGLLTGKNSEPNVNMFVNCAM